MHSRNLSVDREVSTWSHNNLDDITRLKTHLLSFLPFIPARITVSFVAITLPRVKPLEMGRLRGGGTGFALMNCITSVKINIIRGIRRSSRKGAIESILTLAQLSPPKVHLLLPALFLDDLLDQIQIVPFLPRQLQPFLFGQTGPEGYRGDCFSECPVGLRTNAVDIAGQLT